MSLRAAAAVLAVLALVASPTTPVQAAPAATYEQDLDGAGGPDVLSAGLDGRLYLYRGDGAGGWDGRRVYGRGWSLRDEIHVVGDWDGDGRADVVARDITTGNLLLYPGDGSGGLRAARRIGSGWQVFSDLAAPGDFTGDGNPDLLAVRRDNGTLWLYPGNGRAGWQSPRRVGAGWLSRDLLTAVGDWTGDGNVDVVARSPADGRLWLYPGDGAGGWGGFRAIGTGWGRATALVGTGDWDGDGPADLIARNGAGQLVLYRGSGRGGFAPAPYRVVGWGWNSMRLNERTQAPRRVIRYSVSGLGRVGSDVGYFGRHVDWTLNDYRGWSLGWSVRFDRVASGGDFTVYLASPAEVAAASPACSATWSCRVGDRVYVNDERWRRGTATYARRSLDDYRHYVVNHEVGHWFELGHWACPGSGRPAPVMQQQSMALSGCTTNVWPLGSEQTAARDFAF